MADSGLVPRQWETSLQSNTISHRLGTNLESVLYFIIIFFNYYIGKLSMPIHCENDSPKGIDVYLYSYLTLIYLFIY